MYRSDGTGVPSVPRNSLLWRHVLPDAYDQLAEPDFHRILVGASRRIPRSHAAADSARLARSVPAAARTRCCRWSASRRQTPALPRRARAPDLGRVVARANALRGRLRPDQHSGADHLWKLRSKRRAADALE